MIAQKCEQAGRNRAQLKSIIRCKKTHHPQIILRNFSIYFILDLFAFSSTTPTKKLPQLWLANDEAIHIL